MTSFVQPGYATRGAAGADINGNAPGAGALLSETEPGDQRAVPGHVVATEVLEQPPAFADQPHEPSPAGVIVAVHPEVLAQLADAPREKADLDFDRSGVLLVHPALADHG